MTEDHMTERRLSDLNDNSWLGDLVPPGDAQSLTQPSVIETLLRGWAAFLLDVAAKQVDDQITEEAATQQMRAEAARLQAIFYGKDAGYVGGSWSRPQGLGAFLVGPAGLGGDTEDAAERLLRAFWSELAPMFAANLRDELSDEALADGAEELVERYRHYLMGVPLPADYYGD